MKHSNIFPALIFIIYLCLAGCSSAESPEPTAELPANTIAAHLAVPPIQTPQPTTIVTVTAEPTHTLSPIGTPLSSPFPTLSPTPTPTLYPDVWLAGLIWDEARTILYVGSSSANVHGAQITYEPLNESVAEEIAQFPLSTLVVFYGDYTPLGEREGHMVVERVEQVSLTYSEDTPLSESFTHPDYGFSFNYPGEWTLMVSDGGATLSLRNYPFDNEQFYGPSMEYQDPTEIRASIRIEEMSLTDFVQDTLDKFQNRDRWPEYAEGITVTERTINGLPVTQIDQKHFDPYYYVLDHIVSLVVALNDETSIVFRSETKNILLVERLIATLSLP